MFLSFLLNLEQENISGLLTIFILFIFSIQISSFFTKSWTTVFDEVYDVEEADEESFPDLPILTGFDQSTTEVVENITTKFEDVAGNEEAKEELKEIVKFLQDPSSFFKLGAGIPKGVLLSGPPGTGKTLLAKAIAGESGTPFLRVSGSQFVELLVGVGAARVRELFEKARELKPSIIFIDEIDSIARARSSNANVGGANDERDQALNQILTEMDGFSVSEGVVVIAATNRVDILDPAILRPGRFDRQIVIANPNLKEREAILKVHLRGKKIDESVSIPQIAQRTIGFSGADLANLLNEAAILASRKKKKQISTEEINLSIDRIILGLEGSPITRIKEKQINAFHEMGHALLTTITQNKDNVEKISLVPRGNLNASTWTMPLPSLYTTRTLFMKQILISLGGRVSEELLGGISECSTSAQQDIIELTRTLRSMILRYAMSKLQELKQESQQRNLYILGSDVKQELTNLIDNFKTYITKLTYNEIFYFLQNSRPILEKLVDELINSEEINGVELRGLTSQYFTNINNFEYTYNNRESAIFDIIFFEIQKSKIDSTTLKEKLSLYVQK
jgi:cell division protease FtsH